MVEQQQAVQPRQRGKTGPKPLQDGREHRHIATRMSPAVFDRLDTLAKKLGISKAKLIGDLVEEALIARGQNE